ncbi:hypothetical protein AAP_03610 [Ascosphaera apis ARSEF 7405]|uniref:Uncharacterized protein n=1 Tax=Ascosphaera apis ARSEF 7405 TaxID=392613 RepID=A0A167Y807_9EURO|nr:hypothetical protein AAP_03610 [Ascosphaera apis ARSEF 7405]
MSEESDPDVAVSRDMTPTQTFRDRLRHAREKGRASSVPLQSISLAPSLAGSDPGTVPVQLFASLTEDAPHEQPKGESQGLRQQPRFGIPENESHHTFVTTAEAEQHQQPAFVSPHDLQLFDASESITVNPSDVFNRPETELHLPSQSNVPAAEPMTTGEEQAQHHTADEDDLSLSISDNDFAQEHRINLGDSEYAIPLPMDSRIRDEYDSLIENNRSAIAVFLKKTDPRSMEEDDNADSGQDTEVSLPLCVRA